MLLDFPSLDTLALVLKAGLLPPAVAAAPAKAWQVKERWVVSIEKPVDKATLAALKTWNVATKAKGVASGDALEVASLPQLLPLAREPGKIEVSDRLSVLFWLPSTAPLESFVQEILRQGNDRIALRTLTDSDGGEQVLVKVIGPPYYSLLQALEPHAAAPVKAYLERAPRVWVELGQSHPLEAKLQPAAGLWLFLTAPRQWQTLPEAPFRDLYASLELKLPQAPVELNDIETQRLNVPLRLVRGGGYETPELYVLRERAIEQLDAFVQSTSDQTISRLSFAVIEREPEPWVVLRVRPGKDKQPLELVFEGLACRPYLRIANLFVPSGVRVHPPLRRDALKDLLAADANQVVWLQPLADGQFQPQTVDESAFHPLSQWVDYILDRDREPLAQWIRSTTFDFESFVCRDDLPPPKPPQREENRQRPAAPSAKPGSGPATTATAPAPQHEKLPPKAKPTAPASKTPSQMQLQLQALEKQFTALDLPHDAPERAKLWQDMGMLNSVLGHRSDATQCFAHLLWEEGTDQHWAAVEEWLHNETKATPLSWTEALRELTTKKALGALGRLIDLERPLAQHGQIVAALLTNWLQTAKKSVAPATSLQLQTYLQKVEPLMSVRIAWLAWHALYRLSGDELMLARARDRILQRLHQHGLMADVELPLFLRSSSGGKGTDEHRMVRDELSNLHRLAHRWSKENRNTTSADTKDYIDLMFAFGFARLGEVVKSRELLGSAREALHHPRSPVHRWLYEAFEYRVMQLLESEPATGALPERMVTELATFTGDLKLARYKIDRLRERSRILEPHESLDPYRHHTAGRFDPDSVSAKLAELPDVLDEKELLRRLRGVWKTAQLPAEKLEVLHRALQAAWRIDEGFAREMLGHVPAALATSVEAPKRLKLLEIAVLAAAHYDLRENVTILLGQLKTWLTADALKDEKVLQGLEQTITVVFQRLRKLGLRDEIAALLRNAMQTLHTALSSGKDTPDEMRMLLALAGTSLSLGDRTCWSDIERVRTRLLDAPLREDDQGLGVAKQTQLAVSYLRAVGQAPLKEAVAHMREFFEQTKGMRETALVADHYSLKQLEVIETLVLMMTSETFTMDRAARSRLDDEEFLIRRRIHRDAREAMEGKAM